MLQLKNVKKNYLVEDKPFNALKNINLNFEEKGFVSILGPSGCGKTTLLNLIGGLDHYSSGNLIINGKSTKKFIDADWDAYRNKHIGFVFQNYNLIPHLTVLENVEISMKLSGLSKAERRKKAIAVLKEVDLRKVIKKLPNQLSGGQMQRVAIARSLVNDPNIILADEPTGALDSVTSVQVLELLKQVSRTRLVIMVTHNEELANKFSTRIIRLKDGEIVSDTHPLRSKKNKIEKELSNENQKHTHMSFKTALGSSSKSLLTKKGRTIMTAVAASFGIIGVALVLAMSNGFSNYVGNVERATASSVPLTIAPFVTTSFKQTERPESYPSEQTIKPYSQDASQLFTVHHNDLSQELATYCKGLLDKPHQYASSVLENHEYLDFNIFTKRKTTTGGEEIIKVNQFASAGVGGAILSGTTSLPSTIFHELYGNKQYINSMYETIYGTYPSETLKDTDGDGIPDECEVCLVCDRYNQIPIKTLYELGLSSTDIYTDGMKFNFKDLCNHEYKAFLPSDVACAVEQPTIFKNISTKYIPGQSLKILSDDTKQKDIMQCVDVTTRNFSGKYVYPNELDDLYNERKSKAIHIKISGIIRIKQTSLIDLMPGSICYPSALKDYFVKVTRDDPNYQTYRDAARNNWIIKPSTDSTIEWPSYVAQIALSAAAGSSSQITELLNDYVNCPVTFYNLYRETKPDKQNPQLESPTILDKQCTDYLKNNARFSNKFLTPHLIYSPEGVPVDVDMSEIIEGRQVEMCDVIGFITGYSPITSILIFPKTLSDKANIANYIEEWNKMPQHQILDYQVKYADLAGTLTDALGTLIDVITLVLICFSAVALLVSCVMTGVITYTSVLERTKEIGILRAVGARKKDVGRLFEAESVIIGFVGGFIGVLVTFLIEWPISLIINLRFPEQNIGLICNLNPWHALILIIVSMLLTFVAGFIPARKAAKKDPVVALRTE